MTSLPVIVQRWNDSRLEWNPIDYGNLTKISLPVDSIWKPPTSVINSVSGDGFLTTNKDYNYVDMYYNGDVHYFLQALALTTRCILNVSRYPFDSQVCNITFVYWQFISSKFENVIQPQVRYIFDNKTSGFGTFPSQNHPIWDLVNISYTTDQVYSNSGYTIFFFKAMRLCN